MVASDIGVASDNTHLSIVSALPLVNTKFVRRLTIGIVVAAGVKHA